MVILQYCKDEWTTSCHTEAEVEHNGRQHNQLLYILWPGYNTTRCQTQEQDPLVIL